METKTPRAVERRPMQVRFPGGLAVESSYRGFSVLTDQPERRGGAGSAPAPFDLFLASIATCAGYYALQFIASRELPLEGLALALEPVRSADRKRIDTFRITVDLPEGFPDKYRRPLERAIDQCAVKRAIVDPPAFELVLRNGVPADGPSRARPESAEAAILGSDQGERRPD